MNDSADKNISFPFQNFYKVSTKMETLLVTLTLLAALVVLVYKYLTWHHSVFMKLGLAGPRPNIFYGNFPSAITGKQPLVYDVDEIYK